MAISVQPVDDQLEPTGDPFVAVTKSVSPTGLAITHIRAVTARFLRITLRARGREVRTILDVVCCSCAGMHYDIRGDFHTDGSYQARADA